MGNGERAPSFQDVAVTVTRGVLQNRLLVRKKMATEFMAD